MWKSLDEISYATKKALDSIDVGRFDARTLARVEAMRAAAAEAALTSARNRYALGAGDILELLSAQAALADARQERVRTLAEWEAARLRLFASAGIIGRWAFR
ncbi:hypothetical protein WT00_10260 [Burkholderia territorii]|nr:hypothetical protein WT00_10260 [Burkholderia territorii]